VSFERSEFQLTDAFRILFTINATEEYEDQDNQRVGILEDAPFPVTVDRIFL
jgi:hypothetical protein